MSTLIGPILTAPPTGVRCHKYNKFRLQVGQVGQISVGKLGSDVYILKSTILTVDISEVQFLCKLCLNVMNLEESFRLEQS
jgi:hypothetical protein